MRKAKLFIINTFILTLTSLLIQGVSIYFSVYISRKIGTEGVGLFHLIISVYSFFITLASSGINLASTRIVSEQMAKSNNKGAFKVITECIFFSFLMGTLASILLLIFSNIIVQICFKNRMNTVPLYLIAISLPFISMSSAINGYFSATRNITKSSKVQIISQFFTMITATLFLNSIFPKGINYACISLILATCLSEVVSFFYLYLLYKMDRKKYKEKNDLASYKKDIFRICIPVAVTSYIRSGLNTFKHILIPLRLEKFGLSQAKALSKYGIITGMVMPILTFPGVFVNSFASLLIPEFSSIFVTKNYNRIKFLTNKIFKLSFTMSACIFGIFITFGDEILLMIYHNLEASRYFLYLAPLVLIMYVDNIVDGMLRGLDEQVNVMKCNILDLVVSTTFIFFAIPIFSVKAYIASIYISELLNGTISIYLLLKKTNIKFHITDWLLKPIGISLIARYFLYVIDTLFGISNILIKITFYCILFLLLSFLTRILKKSDLTI